MIKLVAADMDGTLLNSRHQLSARLPQVIQALHAQGTRFVVASGRQYYNLLAFFPNMEHEILFLAENGGMIFDGSKLLYSFSIPTQDLSAPLAQVRQIPGAHIILCGTQSAYTDCADDSIFLEHARRYYARLQLVPDLLAAAQQDRICKLAIFLHHAAESILYPSLQRHSTHFTNVLSGDCWVDIMDPAVNKGTAMRFLQQHLSLAPEECMAFGDYPNDTEMMQAVAHSYAMANAHPQLAAVCRFRAPSNDEDGVVQTLLEKFHITR